MDDLQGFGDFVVIFLLFGNGAHADLWLGFFEGGVVGVDVSISFLELTA